MSGMRAESPSTPVTVAVLDNDVFACQAIRANLALLSRGLRVVWNSRSATEALHRCLTDRRPPQVLVVDMVLDDMPGPAVCAQIRRATAGIGLVGITAYPVEPMRRDVAAAGAQALLSKERMNDDALQAIVRAAQGLPAEDDGVFMDARSAHRLLNATAHEFQPLTDREKDILRCFSHGMPVEDICERYQITRNTVFTYTHRVLKKLNVRNRTEALAVCRQYHLLEA